MRNLFMLVSWLLLGSTLTFAQQKKITGQVKDENGNPVPFATVKIKNSSQGVSADANGTFSIETTVTQVVLIISSQGFETYEIRTRAGNEVMINLKTSGQLQEVVVTALGIRRNKNTLPYAAQTVAGDDISRIRTGNAASALSGKVAGLQVIQGNGIGGSTNIIVRGVKSLTNNNQALFVLDGVPVDNSNTNSTNQTTGRGGYDYGNAAADINPDDIESINVLKGAAASALYGSRAANGVIMITTKKAKKGLGITVNSGVRIGKIDKTTFAKYQNQYGAGYSSNYDEDGFWKYFDVNGDGVDDLVVPTSEDASYGTKFDPNLMVYHWDAFDPTSPYYKKQRPWVAAANDASTFYETALSNNNSVLLDGASDKGSFKLGFTRDDEKGVLPNSSLRKNIINFGATYNILPKLTASANANYSKIDGRGRYGTGYSGLNVNQNFRQWYQRNVDIQEQKDAYFRTRKNVTWNWADPSTEAGLVAKYTDNYYWTVYENYETDTRSRVFGNVSLNYEATSWLSFLARVTQDSYTELQEERIAVGSNGAASYIRFDRTWSETNYDLMANVDKQLSKNLNLKGLLGLNMRRSVEKWVLQQTSGGLIVPGLYSIANSKGTIPNPIEVYRPKAVDGYFAGLTLGFKDFIALDGTVRRDRSSTLPESDNAYNYYAVSGSWVFSKQLPAIPWLSYGKLRVNYAEVGNDAQWGRIKDNYDQPTPFGSTTLFSLPSSKNNDQLKPERTNSKEIGVEMAFLKSRVGLDVTYYITNTKDQLIPVSTSTATGYSSKYVNAGDVQNKGLELSVYATPVKTAAFSWTVNLNFTRNRNKVVELFVDETGTKSQNLLLGSFQGGVSVNATIDQPFGTIQGRTYTMIDPKDPTRTIAWDGSQPKVVRADGYYAQTSTTTNVIGNYNPDWIGGIYNTFKYQNFSLGFLLDVRKGGNVWSLDQYYGQNYTGIYPESVRINDIGNPIRDNIIDDTHGGGMVLPGVLANGTPNTKRVAIDANQLGDPPSAFSYDASYVKLRETIISYALPQSIFRSVNAIKGVEFSVIGRNLWIIHKNLPYADPEENLSSGNIQGMQSGAYPTTRSIGFNVKVRL